MTKEQLLFLIKDSKSLNDIALLIFNKKNHYNRLKVKQMLIDNNIDYITLFKTNKTKPIKYCLNCNKEITSYHAVKFCSRSCSVIYNNKIYKKKHEVKQCLNCNKTLINHKYKFCSKSCEAEHKYKKTIVA